MNAPIKTEDRFHQLIHQNHMWGLWEIASQMTPQPRPEAIAYQWKWALLKEVVKQSASAVLHGAPLVAQRHGARRLLHHFLVERPFPPVGTGFPPRPRPPQASDRPQP